MFPRRFGATRQNIIIQQAGHGGLVLQPLCPIYFCFCMVAWHTHLVSSKSKSTGVDTVKKKCLQSCRESWLWFQLLFVHLAEFAEAALVFNVTYIRKAGFSSLPVTVDVSTSTLTHVRPPVMSSLHSPGTTSASSHSRI